MMNEFIDKSNYKMIGKKLKCHDTLFQEFEFNYDTHSLNVLLSESPFSNVRSILFENVVCFRGTWLEQWGRDQYVFDWQYLDFSEADTLFHDVFQQMKKGGEYDLNSLICSEFVFASGDKIQIICNTIKVEMSND